MRLARSLILVVLTLALNVASAQASTISGFSGPYDSSQWTTNTAANCDGQVTAAAASLTITGCDNASGTQGEITYTAVAAGSGTVSFAYSYSTLDADGFDEFLYLRNGVGTTVANFDGALGSPSFTVNAGDVFGFEVISFDNTGGAGVVSIRDFSAPGPDDTAPVPEPASLTLLGLGLAGMAGRRWRQRKA